MVNINSCPLTKAEAFETSRTWTQRTGRCEASSARHDPGVSKGRPFQDLLYGNRLLKIHRDTSLWGSLAQMMVAEPPMGAFPRRPVPPVYAISAHRRRSPAVTAKRLLSIEKGGCGRI